MMYASFGLLVGRWEVWVLYSYVWGVTMLLKMLVKDYTLSKKAGWPKYESKTYMITPKIFNSASLSLIVNVLVGFICYHIYETGGF